MLDLSTVPYRSFGIIICLGIIFWISSKPMGWMHLYPLKFGSRLMGSLASTSLPPSLMQPLLERFISSYGLAMDEAEYPLSKYKNLQELFTRRLKPGLRPQDSWLPGSVNSPVDGTILATGPVKQGMMLQAKGKSYRLEELILSDRLAQDFEGGYYMTLYLAPYNYHRFHMPVDGIATDVSETDGTLWPVNVKAVENIDRLYVKNKRVVLMLESSDTPAFKIGLVFVGATHVGRIHLLDQWKNVPTAKSSRGDEIGTFEFGSTVILLVGGPKSSAWKPTLTNGIIKVGQRLGALK